MYLERQRLVNEDNFRADLTDAPRADSSSDWDDDDLWTNFWFTFVIIKFVFLYYFVALTINPRHEIFNKIDIFLVITHFLSCAVIDDTKLWMIAQFVMWFTAVIEVVGQIRSHAGAINPFFT